LKGEATPPREVRVVGGEIETRCTNCRRWWTLEYYRRSKRMKFGREARCKMCRRRDARRRYRNGAMEKQNERRRFIRAMDREADLQHEATLVGARVRRNVGVVPVEVVRRWLEIAKERYPDDAPVQTMLAFDLDVPVRSIFRVESGESANISFDLAERIARLAGCESEIEGYIGVTGEPGWSAHSDHCLRCGTWWRRHHAKGLCFRCYSVVWWAKKKRRPIPLPPDAWTSRWPFCRICDRVEHKHQCHGVCTGCYLEVRRAALSSGLTMREFMERNLFLRIRERKLARLGLKSLQLRGSQTVARVL
jgi:hypothetical protein